jgi:hypothetical protein
MEDVAAIVANTQMLLLLVNSSDEPEQLGKQFELSPEEFDDGNESKMVKQRQYIQTEPVPQARTVG